jgi:prepilin-type N-terminal cleavage/methylation domain-containing protein
METNVKKQGFTLIEALISLTLLSVLASLLIPMLNTNVGEDKLYEMGLDGIAQVTSAYNAYARKQLPGSNTAIASILEQNINYVKKITNGSNGVQYCTAEDANGNCTASAELTCAAPYSCLLLQNGAVLLYDSSATGIFGGGTANVNAVHVMLDPDGNNGYAAGVNNGQNAIPLVLFVNGRISTYRYASTGGAIFADGVPNAVFDPEYILPWTDG